VEREIQGEGDLWVGGSDWQGEMLSDCSYAIEFLFSLCCAHFLTHGFPSHALVRYSSTLVNL
jgi:hypothetical protein